MQNLVIVIGAGAIVCRTSCCQTAQDVLFQKKKQNTVNFYH